MNIIEDEMETVTNPNRISYTSSNGTIQYIENNDCINIYHLFVVSAPRVYFNDLMVQLLALQDFYNLSINPREREYIRSKVIVDIVRIIEGER